MLNDNKEIEYNPENAPVVKHGLPKAPKKRRGEERTITKQNNTDTIPNI